MGLVGEAYPVPAADVQAYGMQSITNLVVRRRYGEGGPVIGLNAHGDVVPPGDGWTHDPYGGEVVDGKLYGRAAAVSKSDFASYTFALRALESLGLPLKGGVDLLFTYDEEFGGELGPDWLLDQGLTKPDFLLAAGFSYQVVTAHNGCLQMAVTVHGKMAHAAIPHTGVDALQGAVAILNALYAQNTLYQGITSQVEGITHPYLNVGRIEGGTNTNVVPGKVVFKLDRRMIPEENPAEVEATIRRVIAEARGHPPRHHGRDQAPAAGRGLEARPAATRRWCRRCSATARRCSASPSRPAARRCTPTCACSARTASRPRSTAPGRAPCARATPNAPTNTWCSTTCGAPPRWWHARCWTC